MADTRTPEQKRADNLKDLVESGAKNPDTLSEGSKKLLSGRGDNVLQTPTGVYVIPTNSPTAPQPLGVNPNDAIQTPFGTFKPGQTPFEQLQNQKGAFYESAKLGYEGFKVTQQYNQQGLEYAMGQGADKYAEEYSKAKGSAVDKKITERNTSLFQQSALGDLMTSGLIVAKGEGNDLYLSEKGQNLGTQNFYSLEQNAIWGKSFDFIVSDDGALAMYPEGTRGRIAEADMKEPVLLEKDGEQFLVIQKSGKDKIKVAPIDTISNRVLEPEEKDFSGFLDLSSLEVQENAHFEYVMDESGFKVKATGVSKKTSDSGFDFWPKFGGEATPTKEKSLEKVSEKTAWYESPPIETAMTQFYERNDAFEMTAQLRGFEKSIGAVVPNPIPGTGIKEIGLVSAGPYLFASGVETTIKSGVAFGSLLFTGGEVLAKGNKLTDFERQVKASELVASGPYLMTAPMVATFSVAGFMEAKTPAAVKNPNPQRLKLLSVRMEGGVPVEEYNLMTLTRYKPDYAQAVSSFKAGVKMPELSFSSAMKGGVGAAEGAYQGGKVLNLMAGSEKVVVRQLAASESPVAAYAAVTAAGLNPFSATKPSVQRFNFKVKEPQTSMATKAVVTPSVLTAFYKANPQLLKGVSPKQTFQPTTKAPEMPNVFEGERISERQRIVQEARMEDIYLREAGRTKYEQVQAIREMNRAGYGYRTRVAERVGLSEITRVGTGVRVGLGESPRYGELERTGQKLRQKQVEKFTPRIIVPPIMAPGREGKQPMFKEPKAPKIRTSYAPSLAGVLGGKVEKNIKKRYSGFEVRGIRRGKTKHGLF